MDVALADISRSDSAARWIRSRKVIHGSGSRDVHSSEMVTCLGLVRFSYTIGMSVPMRPLCNATV
jgi:hypothetical protein